MKLEISKEKDVEKIHINVKAILKKKADKEGGIKLAKKYANHNVLALVEEKEYFVKGIGGGGYLPESEIPQHLLRKLKAKSK